MGFQWDSRLSDAGATTAQFCAPRPRLNPHCPGRTSDPQLICLVTLRRDEGSGSGARGECRVDVDETGAARIEADRNLSFRILDFDLPFTVQRERARPTAEGDSLTVIEESGVGNWNGADKTGRNRDRHRSRRRSGIPDRNPGTRRAVARSRKEGAA